MARILTKPDHFADFIAELRVFSAIIQQRPAKPCRANPSALKSYFFAPQKSTKNAFAPCAASNRTFFTLKIVRKCFRTKPKVQKAAFTRARFYIIKLPYIYQLCGIFVVFSTIRTIWTYRPHNCAKNTPNLMTTCQKYQESRYATPIYLMLICMWQ